METFENALPVGTLLDNRYKIESVLGEGGFGVTYKAHDSELDYSVVIKEFLPQECAARGGDSITVQARTNRTDDYQYGLERFLDEARNLAKFQHPHIVTVTNFLKVNGTAYFVMNYAEGEDLSDWLKKHEVLNEALILKIITPIIEGLAEVHKVGLLHRDIKPGNIFMRKKGGPMLIDFGAARQALGEHSKSISAIISQGYAPPEQYTTRGKQGPFTDLYAVGAVLYKLITGQLPIESTDRSHAVADEEADPLIPCAEAGKGKVSDWLLELIDQMLQLRPKHRPQTAEAVLQAIQNKTTANVGADSSAQPSSKQSENKTRVVKSSERFAKQSNAVPVGADSSAQTSKGKTPIIAVAVVAIAVIAGGGWWFSQSNTADVGANSFAQNGGNNSSAQSKALAKGNAILYVDSQPADAEIYLDNILLGRTPYKSETLPKGEHEIKLSHASAEIHKEKLVLKDNIIVKKQYQLKAASGSVSLFSTPEGARIALDGKDTGLATPATLESVATGDHKITLHKNAYYPKEVSISVLKGKAIREDLTLEGGHLVEYKGEWLEPEEKEKRIADAKHIAERQTADAREAKRVVEQQEREQKAADYRKQANTNAQQGNVETVKSLLVKAAMLVKNHTEDKKLIAYAMKQRQRALLLVGEIIHVPAGSFQMGSDFHSSELPVHRVGVKAFKLGKYEVTQKQWLAVMGNSPSKFKNCDDCPVSHISWVQAQEFIKKLNQRTGQTFRLPSEAEWEYACRSGGEDQEYCGGEDLGDLAWNGNNSHGRTHPVGKKQANGLGFYDMSGNVREWVEDCWNEDYKGAPTDSKPWLSGNCEIRAHRGGGWLLEMDIISRSSIRGRSSVNEMGIGVGFRLAQDVN